MYTPPPLDNTYTNVMNILHLYPDSIVSCDLIRKVLSKHTQSLGIYEDLYTGCNKRTFIKDYRVKIIR